jgi:K319-like protein
VGSYAKWCVWSSYTRDANNNISTTERTVGSTIYLENAVQCPYVWSGSYNFPPCVRLVDDQWLEITHHLKLNPVATNFSVSGTTLSRPNTFNSAMVGRGIYIAGDGYYQIIAFIDSGNVSLSSSPVAGSNKTVYISGSATGTLQEYMNGSPVVDVTDQIMTWDTNPAGWGEIRLLPHQTNKVSGLTYTPGAVWYDDLVISTQPIAMGASAPPLATNAAPTVNAGPDQTITLPTNSVSLSGSASDDGLPNNKLTYQWSGPSGVTFSNATSLTTIATFPAAGAYTLTLTVSDGVLSSSDSVTITDSPAVPTNKPPTVNAGPDITDKMPPNSVTLSGTATDDGLPNGSLTYQWTAPAGVTLATPNSLRTKATFAAPGTYTITLTVSDGALSSSDSVVVTMSGK